MQDVNIYIGTSFHGPARRDGEYIYILEHIRDGIPITREGMGRLEGVTENQLALTALAEALDRINCPCSLRVHTSCQHILNSMQNSWTRQWQKNGWKTAKGTEVRNTDLWARIMGQLDRHRYTFTDGDHTYSGWMEGQLKPDGRKHG